tara:strand:+ start:120544 stop:121752 length:1209 start_codon:yes stop_codon:yes gene_type:complete
MTKTTQSISLQEAKRLVLVSQQINTTKPKGKAIDATLSALEQLGYIQIDTISVIERAHHHTLWNRNSKYTDSHLDDLIANKQVFEYWSHAAAYLPMRDYRFTLPRKQAIANGAQNHWYQRNEKMMKFVLQRIRDEGPLMAKNFVHKGEKLAEWQSKPTKQALEYLFMQGDLMISSRKNFHKVYDLTERVLPDAINTATPTTDEYARFLITQYLQANGLGQASEMGYLLKGVKKLLLKTLQNMVEQGELVQIMVNMMLYYTLPDTLEVLGKIRKNNAVKILSPFDNLVIQRKRMQALFDFDYLLECYVPVAKRKYGYFTLPILWNENLVARMDCKVDRKNALLHMHHLALEPGLDKATNFAFALGKELQAFMQFNNCTQLQLHKTTPAVFKPELQSAIHDIMP